ncbi:MHFG family PEP-CTERM protein [Aquabacterium sp. OR-4]|uniref:MHFG family PEP-CTERM protein n=1 Tax=Aquabacterium sp. OR-4 TaxID=2978127 RepID=UPI0028C61258|nr:MHFG family PEP-CTERM protein [Aquabacterium sp. OR-4]MDT7834013.1 MHFG family PEP-CTERM protein [Aquabacterium sp. OR-4]
MSLALAVAVAAAPATLPACSWDRPGHRPFTGDLVAAVDRYADIPAPVRARLKARMAQRQYDEIVEIRRDRIDGRRGSYQAEIRDMHFGSGQVCGTVTRAGWPAQALERGLVYCEDGHCLLVPTVCRNLSRIQRNGPAVAAASGEAAPGGGAGAPAAAPALARAAPATDVAGAAGGPGAGGDLGSDMAAAPDSFALGAEPGAAEAAASQIGRPQADEGPGGGSGHGAAGWASGGGTGGGWAAGPVGGLVGSPVSGSGGGSGSGASGGGGSDDGLPGSGIAFVPPGGLGDRPAFDGVVGLPAAPVPEPATLGLWALGLAGLLLLKQRQRRRPSAAAA